MTITGPLFDQVVSLLSGASDDKPWMTARYLARRLGNRVDGRQIEDMLLVHCQDAEDNGETPLIRYSSLPSRKTLEVLWGAIEKVGRRPLENITQNHVADDALNEFEALEAADIFVSHSHRDYPAVKTIARYLLQNDIVPWLAETHIEQDKHIHTEIINALGASQDFLLYLSSNALDSRWTGKEYFYAAHRGIPIFIVADIESVEVHELLRAIAGHKPVRSKVTQNFSAASAEFLSHLVEDNNRIVEVFVHSQTLGFDVVHPFARPVSELPSRIRKRRADRSVD